MWWKPPPKISHTRFRPFPADPTGGIQASYLVVASTTCQLLNSSFQASFPSLKCSSLVLEFQIRVETMPKVEASLTHADRPPASSISLSAMNCVWEMQLSYFHGCCFQHQTTIPDAGKATWKGGVCISQTHSSQRGMTPAASQHEEETLPNVGIVSTRIWGGFTKPANQRTNTKGHQSPSYLWNKFSFSS